MKVLHVFNELKFSGAEIMYADAAEIFQANGCQLTALSTSSQLGDFAERLKVAGFSTMHRPYPKLKNYFTRIRYYASFVQMLKQQRFDVVHIHRSDAMWGISLCAWLAGKKAVYTYHSVFPSRKLTFLYHCLLRWSAKTVFGCRLQTISDSVYEHELSFFHNKTKKIYNWYGSKRFFPALTGEKIKVRNELSIPQDAFVMVSVGGCSPIKRHSEIIKALPHILRNDSTCLYLHIGSGCSETDEKELAKKLNVFGSIRFLGNQSDIRKYLIASDVFLMTSRFEGIGITAIEALACGIPAVLYKVPGLKDFNNKGNHCFLIPEDPRILAEKIIEIKNYPDTALQMAARGTTFVVDTFSMSKNAQQIFDLYQ